MVATNPSYRNNRKTYYQEKGPDFVSVGSIINVFKTKPNNNSFDSQYIPLASSSGASTSSYTTGSGNAQPDNNPEYQYYGYLYCDGSEYNIKDYPLLYSVIGNKYGGTPGTINGVQIAEENVFQYWPDPNMGTFKVPDLKAKKIVGYGPVYGSGTPTIGNVEMIVGATGGTWYLSKDTQKGYFNLGNIRTLGYTDVVAPVSGNIVGYQQITVTLEDNDLGGVPQHEHYLLHSEAPNVQGFDAGLNADPYLVGYRNRTGRTIGFAPSGGIKLTHSHALSKQRISGQNVATYDLFNYTGGDTGPGTVKPNGNYWASGPSGNFVEVTFTPQSLFKIFSNSSQIGGQQIVDGGTPFYTTTVNTFSSPGTSTVSIGPSVDILEIEAYGGGGSGGVWTQAGNSGQNTVIKLGDGTPLTITLGGGQGGGAVQENTSVVPYTEIAGSGGLAGTNTVTGTYANAIDITSNTQGAGALQGQPGSQGKFWNAQYTSSNTTWKGDPGGVTYGVGTAGEFLTVSSTAKGTTADVSYPNTGTFDAASTDSAKWKVQSASISIYGGRGRDCQNLGGSYTTGVGQYSTNSGGCVTGVGGAGKFMTLSVKANSLGVIQGSFSFFPGQSGRVYANSAGTTYGAASGGSAGDGFLQDGGGGGSASVVTLGSNTGVILAGAGGGGGGGGAGEGQCGDSATNNPITDSIQDVGSSTLFGGSGGTGGSYGCTGGGGGGGGGGVGTAGQTGGAQGSGDSGGASAGGPGGGGGGFGGHGGGYGGARGLSSYRSDYFSLVASGNSPYTEGRVIAETIENRSYWTSGAGGGGGGGRMEIIVPESVMSSANASALTVTIGAGGAGVSKSINRTINSTISWTESANTVTSGDAGSGYVKVTQKTYAGSFGGTETVTSGDIIIDASSGIQIYASGSGQGTSGGFKLPTTQVPTVQIRAQGDQPGSGATATATVTNGIVSGITLGNGGSGYLSPPTVRFLNGSGGGTRATTQINTSGAVTSISLVGSSSQQYTRYVKIGGPELERFIVIASVDCTDVKSFGIKCARGNNINGGERPDDSGDQLRLYYNTDGSLNFPDSNFIGILVPRPSDNDIAINYDGDGSGGNSSTLWYSYFLDLPEGAKTNGVRFKLVQSRTTANPTSNDNANNSDHFGILEFIYEYKFVTETQFINTAGEISGDSKTLAYIIEGSNNSSSAAGIEVNDMTFTMSAGVPLSPSPALDPVRAIPLIEPYCLTKYLIKAF